MPTPPISDDELLEALRVATEYGPTEAARRLKLARTTLQDRVYRAREKFPDFRSELDERVATGFELRGYSQLTKTQAGEPIWLKTRKAERDYWEGIKSALEKVRPVERIPAPPTLSDSDVIPWLQIGDGHIGMQSWEDETHANYDISIAKQEYMACTGGLISEAPKSQRLVVHDLGDGTHYENYRAMTEASGHPVDFDTRFPKMIEAYIDITCHTIDRALERAATVDCIFNQGNHSRTNDIWIAELVRRLYGKTGRVNVLQNRNAYIAYRMGKTLVGIQHGDKVKPEKFRDVMSTDYAADWGETEFRYLDGGHVHHSQRKELGGCVFESWNNLAPRDKYAHDGGWRSKQCMSVVLRSRTYGEVGRSTMPIERVRDIVLEKHPDHYVPPQVRAFAA